MRINAYAEELTERVELVEKVVDGRRLVGVRFYLYLPVRDPAGGTLRGPFNHKDGDDDSAAITFWGEGDVEGVQVLLRMFAAAREVLRPAVVDLAMGRYEAIKFASGVGIPMREQNRDKCVDWYGVYDRADADRLVAVAPAELARRVADSLNDGLDTRATSS